LNTPWNFDEATKTAQNSQNVPQVQANNTIKTTPISNLNNYG
jgi:hypothetical protein